MTTKSAMNMTFTCERCKKAMGEMSKGKIRKGYAIVCSECLDIYKQSEVYVQMHNGGAVDGYGLPDILSMLGL